MSRMDLSKVCLPLKRKREKAKAAMVVRLRVSRVLSTEIFSELPSQVKKGKMGLVDSSLKLSKLALAGISCWLPRSLTGFKAAETIHKTGKMLNKIKTAARAQRRISPTRLVCDMDCGFLDIFSYLLPHIGEPKLCQGHDSN